MTVLSDTFMSKYRRGCFGAVAETIVDDYIDEWHTTNPQESLAEFLGMTDDEYVKFALTGNLPE